MSTSFYPIHLQRVVVGSSSSSAAAAAQRDLLPVSFLTRSTPHARALSHSPLPKLRLTFVSFTECQSLREGSNFKVEIMTVLESIRRLRLAQVGRLSRLKDHRLSYFKVSTLLDYVDKSQCRKAAGHCSQILQLYIPPTHKTRGEQTAKLSLRTSKEFRKTRGAEETFTVCKVLAKC